MAIRKPKEQSEVTIIATLNLTDIVKVPNDDEKAMRIAEKEFERLKKALQKLSGVDNVDIQRVKYFPNVKSEADVKG